MTEQKIRAIWITDDLFEKSAEGDRTKAQVIADAGFNLVLVSMNPNTDDTRSGVVDPSKPLEVKHDRSKSTDLETRLESNIAEARRVGLHFFVGWKYGTHHLEPYRKFYSPLKGLAKYTCCPLDEAYIAGQHVGKWAVKTAQGGADGIGEGLHKSKPCIKVFVVKKSSESVQQIPAVLDGYTVVVEESEEIRPQRESRRLRAAL